MKSPEDAVFVDLDNDGNVDVVSSCEGNTKKVFVHWAPLATDTCNNYFNSACWATQSIPAAPKKSWMFALPMDVDGLNGIDLVVGAKTDYPPQHVIGWLEAPINPRDMNSWIWHPPYEGGWIMSLVPVDMDGDGDLDILASDRSSGRGNFNRGILWLEHPQLARDTWDIHRIGPMGVDETMLLDVYDVKGNDERLEILVPTCGATCESKSQHKGLLIYDREADIEQEPEVIPFPANVGSGKAVRVGDINLDGLPDVVLTFANADNEKSGVIWLSLSERVAHEISGVPGIKFDLAELVDLDNDGDLDVITTEELSNNGKGLGVIWYENPTQ